VPSADTRCGASLSPEGSPSRIGRRASMWVARYCPRGLCAAPCPLMGGLHPEFAPGPADGRFNGHHAPDFPYLYLARCEVCAGILGRERARSRMLTWVPEDAAMTTLDLQQQVSEFCLTVTRSSESGVSRRRRGTGGRSTWPLGLSSVRLRLAGRRVRRARKG
jgi:hypothetical protein